MLLGHGVVHAYPLQCLLLQDLTPMSPTGHDISLAYTRLYETVKQLSTMAANKNPICQPPIVKMLNLLKDVILK